MGEFFHGARARETEIVAAAPVVAYSGVPFVIGTAPVQSAKSIPDGPVLCHTFEDAVKYFGYSDDWETYTLCEAMYSTFKLFGVSPVIFVNVLDLATNKKTVEAAEKAVVNKQVKLPFGAIASTVTVTGDTDSPTYALGTDYKLFYDKDALILEVLPSGEAAAVEKLKIGYDEVDTSTVTKADIIGGTDAETHVSTGLDLIDTCYPKFLVAPDLILCPGWSHEADVAAAMAVKAESINGGMFRAHALIDADCSTVTHYSGVSDWKTTNNITAASQIVFWPQVKLGDKQYHLSVQAAGVIAATDLKNGSPCESPSNKKIYSDATVLADGTEVLMDLQQANTLNKDGIVTVQNTFGGPVLWGNYTAVYPEKKDVKNAFISVNRMFAWISKSLILTTMSKVDRPLTRRLIDSIADSANIWLNGLVATEQLLGGRVEVLENENPIDDLMAGIVHYHVYICPPSPAQEINFVVSYDADYAGALLA